MLNRRAYTAALCGAGAWAGIFFLIPHSPFLAANAGLLLNLVPWLGLLICGLAFNYLAARDPVKTFWATGILAGMVCAESLATLLLAGSLFGLIGIVWGGFWIYRLLDIEKYFF